MELSRTTQREVSLGDFTGVEHRIKCMGVTHVRDYLYFGGIIAATLRHYNAIK